MLAFMIMTYSTDLRKRVLDFINDGGSKAAAKRTFGISRRTIYNWLETEDPLASEKPGPKGPRNIDYAALQQHVADSPDANPHRTRQTLRCFQRVYLLCL